MAGHALAHPDARKPAALALRIAIVVGVLMLTGLALAWNAQRTMRSLSPLAPATRLLVLGAASLADAFREIGAAFERENAGMKVEFSFAGSNQLRTQLENGGPGDVFASADRKQMDAASASGVVDGATALVFARNRLAVIVPRENGARIASLRDLGRPGMKIVVADRAVPAGTYTRLMLERAGTDKGYGAEWVKQFEANVRSREENVAAVTAKVALGEADAGIAYASDAAGGNAARLAALPIPEGLDQRAEYVIAVTARAGDAAAARRFIAFVSGDAGRRSLTTRGFMGRAEVAASGRAEGK